MSNQSEPDPIEAIRNSHQSMLRLVRLMELQNIELRKVVDRHLAAKAAGALTEEEESTKLANAIEVAIRSAMEKGYLVSIEYHTNGTMIKLDDYARGIHIIKALNRNP